MLRDIARSSWHRGHRGATGDRRASSRSVSCGGVAEWLKAPVLKTVRGESLSRVRIPPPPPEPPALLCPALRPAYASRAVSLYPFLTVGMGLAGRGLADAHHTDFSGNRGRHGR